MQAPNQKRYYTPQFSTMAVVFVRRLARFLGVSMPKAVDVIVSKLPSIFSPSTVCLQCKDNTKCSLCVFYQPSLASKIAENATKENVA